MPKYLDELNSSGKKVLLRCDFNVPLKGGQIDDDTRIREALPTIKELLDGGAAIILMSHLGRPKGEVVKELSLSVVAERLGELLGRDIKFCPEITGDIARQMASELKEGQVLLLENLRFDPGEKSNSPELAKELAGYADIFVQDAFGTAHREHASMVGVPTQLPSYAGRLLQKEIDYLSKALEPEHPFVVCLGGAKLETKIPVIENMMGRADIILIGGGMAYTLMKAEGREIGKSLFDRANLEVAENILKKAEKSSTSIELPVDHVIADDFDNPQKIENTDDAEIPEDMMALDIGKKTGKLYRDKISGVKTLVFNGPMGVFEKEEFFKGTAAVIKAIIEATEAGAVSIVGGGDTVSAITRLGFSKEKFTHVSTGGGASLKFLEGKELPGIKVLNS
ncbi:MAG: phosphoglycerate kinase [Elusimicrobiota bacterium]|nr:phosphoglycerate kinase [Elusimicrobiota bacterium]